MSVRQKRYLRMNIELVSSLSIGSGENDNTDHDILLNANGIPYIPGSAVAGVTRHAMAEAGLLTREEDREIFGYVTIQGAELDDAAGNDANQPAENAAGSQIVTYDVMLKAADGRFTLTSRDMVALDEYKTAVDGAKFDMEALEPGVTGTVIIEENQEGASSKDSLLLIARLWNSNRIRFGAKTTRGYGIVKATSFYEASFDLTNPEEVKAWLAFSPLDAQSARWQVWNAESIGVVQTNETQLQLGLSQVGGISIRKYTTEVHVKRNLNDPEDKEPDYEQMTYHNGDPVIPGTSWAGAFRHEIQGFVGKEIVKNYYGMVEGDHKRRSGIYFSESRITGGTSKEFTRCAINRFTGGSADKSLYTERTYYGGNTTLTVTLRDDNAQDGQQFRNALAAAVVDLHEGILAVGGETSIGRGLFKVTSVNGQPAADDAAGLYAQVRGILGEEAQA